MNITSDFDGGNIQVVDAGDPNNIRLRIETDNASDFYQWFYFRIDGANHIPLSINIENAGGASFAAGFATLRTCISYD